MDTVMNSAVAAVGIKKRIVRESSPTWAEGNALNVNILSSIFSLELTSSCPTNPKVFHYDFLFQTCCLPTAFSSDFCAWTDNDLGLFACSTTTIGAQISWYLWCSKLVKMTWKQGRNHFILPCGPHWPQTGNSLAFISLLQGLHVGHHTWAK